MYSTTFLCIVLLAAAVQAQRMSQIVQTDKGPVQGRVFQTVWHSKDYSAFEGIPFAQPPVGPLRFKKPELPDPWTEVKIVQDNTNFCAQVLTLGTSGEEDCLYLNVYTPVVDIANVTVKKPVMVYTYGGGFTTGWSWPGVYGPDYLLEQDVLVVIFNYRIDILGFLALDVNGEQLGNAALWDQNLALKWVQKNIAAFGGDPNQVTLFGESAGAASVSFQMFMPESAGLFHKVILQSSSALCPWAYHSRPEAIQDTMNVARALGFYSLDQTEVFNFLQQQSAADLLEVSRVHGSYSVPGPLYFPFVPTSTDDSVDNCPIAKLRTGNFTKVPVLMGYNDNEAALFSLGVDALRQGLSDALETISRNVLFSSTIMKDFANIVMNGTQEEIIKLASTYHFVTPMELTQRYFVKNSPFPVYYYYFSYDSKYNLHKFADNRIKGVAHADDLGVIWNIAIISNNDPTNIYNVYRQNVVELWANFAKTGNPTPDNVPVNGAVWEPSGVSGLQFNLNETFSMVPRQADLGTLMWEQFYDSYSPYTTLCDDPVMLGTPNAFS